MSQKSPTRRAAFETPYHPEAKYVAQLRKFAKNVHAILGSFPQNDPAQLPAMRRALEAYNEATKAWAAQVAITMLKETRAAQQRQWEQLAPRVNTIKSFTEKYHNGQTSRETRALQSQRLDRSGKTPVGPFGKRA